MKIGIALAAYLPEPRSFEKQLQSLLDQTHADWFCVVTCDSPLADLFKDPGLAKFKNHPRFRWHENDHRLGVTLNFEKAIQHCLEKNPDAIACCDQDDLWYPQKLARTLEVFRVNPPPRLVHTDMDVLYQDESGGEKKADKTGWRIEQRGLGHVGPFHFLIRNIVAGCSMIFDAELARKHPRVPTEFYHPDHWYPFLASVYGRVHSLPEPTYAYRLHSGNVLGLTPFKGLLHYSGEKEQGGVLKKARRVFLKSRDLVQAAEREKIPVPFFQKLPVTAWDLGFLLFLMGVCYWLPPNRDLPLARACLARALGKMLFFIPVADKARSL